MSDKEVGVNALEERKHPSDEERNTGKSWPSSQGGGHSKLEEQEEYRPPLPPRPTLKRIDDGAGSAEHGLRSRSKSKAHLQAKPTTAVSLGDVNTQSFQDGSRETYFSFPERLGFGKSLKSKPSLSQFGDASDSVSIKSYVPGGETAMEDASLFGDFSAAVLDVSSDRPDGRVEPTALSELEDEDVDEDFESEFEPVDEVKPDESNVGKLTFAPGLPGRIDTNNLKEEVMKSWRGKRKHFFILSAAGKPIYARHGDDGLISNYIGVIQTLMSFYQGADNPLKSFTAGRTKTAILTQGPLYLVAISRLTESEAQLRSQLEALYMQILSTLTLPTLERLFSVRPSTDLRRPLQGTENLLSSLADSFTKGSPSTLLTALECLKIRNSHRLAINNVLLRTRVNPLLYGLVVAGGRLVSVIRPKKHSLHPGDLQLIFNMIFEADGVKAGGGENWIPVCLPGFNNTGFLHMYVSFLDLEGKVSDDRDEEKNKDKLVAIILISPDKESFFTLREMRDAMVEVWTSLIL